MGSLYGQDIKGCQFFSKLHSWWLRPDLFINLHLCLLSIYPNKDFFPSNWTMKGMVSIFAKKEKFSCICGIHFSCINFSLWTQRSQNQKVRAEIEKPTESKTPVAQGVSCVSDTRQKTLCSSFFFYSCVLFRESLYCVQIHIENLGCFKQHMNLNSFIKTK